MIRRSRRRKKRAARRRRIWKRRRIDILLQMTTLKIRSEYLLDTDSFVIFVPEHSNTPIIREKRL